MVKIIRCGQCKNEIKTNHKIKINGKLYHLICGYMKYKKNKKK